MQNFWTLNDFVKNAVNQKVLRTEMFAVDLNQFMHVQRTYVNFLNVPWVVRLCADDIIRRGLRLEGLFRVPGNHEVIADICKTFNEGDVPDFSPASLEEVSGVFKKYIRELPQALLTCDEPISPLAAKFAAVVELPTEEEKVIVLNQLIKEISIYRRALTKEIFLLLYLVSLESEHNFMDALNLATIFGGMVNIISNTMFSDEKKSLCATLIENYPKIFGDIDIVTPLPLVEFTEEQKEKKIVISIFLDDGTFKSMFIKQGDTVPQVRSLLMNKLSHLKIQDTSKWYLFQLQDREVRQLEETELVSPLVEASTCLLFTDKINLEELKTPWHVSLAKRTKVEFQEARQGLPTPILTPKKAPQSQKPEETLKQESIAPTEPSPAVDSPPQVEIVIQSENGRKEPATQDLDELLKQFCHREEEYMEQLNILIQFGNSLKPLLLPEDYSNIFGSLGAIQALHLQMASRLTPSTIFTTITGMVSYFKMYGQIRASEQLCGATLQKIQKDEKSRAAVAKCQKESKSSVELGILLQLPQKRLQEIENSLEELIKHIEPSSKLQTQATKALNQISALNLELNEQAEISKSGYLLLQLSKEIEDLPNGFALFQPSRRFLSDCQASVRVDNTTIKQTCHLVHGTAPCNAAHPFKKKKGFALGKQKKKEAQFRCEAIFDITTNTTLTQANQDADFIGEVVTLTNENGTVLTIYTEDAKKLKGLLTSAINQTTTSRQTFATAQLTQSSKSAEPLEEPTTPQPSMPVPISIPTPTPLSTKSKRSNKSFATSSSAPSPSKLDPELTKRATRSISVSDGTPRKGKKHGSEGPVLGGLEEESNSQEEVPKRIRRKKSQKIPDNAILPVDQPPTLSPDKRKSF